MVAEPIVKFRGFASLTIDGVRHRGPCRSRLNGKLPRNAKPNKADVAPLHYWLDKWVGLTIPGMPYDSRTLHARANVRVYGFRP